MATTTTPRRAGQFRKVGENLYRYSSNEIYYAVFRVNGKLIWKSLETEDRELAKRRLKEELEKHGRVNGALRGMTLQELITSYENQLAQFDERTQQVGSPTFWPARFASLLRHASCRAWC